MTDLSKAMAIHGSVATGYKIWLQTTHEYLPLCLATQEEAEFVVAREYSKQREEKLREALERIEKAYGEGDQPPTSSERRVHRIARVALAENGDIDD